MGRGKERARSEPGLGSKRQLHQGEAAPSAGSFWRSVEGLVLRSLGGSSGEVWGAWGFKLVEGVPLICALDRIRGLGVVWDAFSQSLMAF